MRKAVNITLAAHAIFFLLLSCGELFFSEAACEQGLAGPLTTAGPPAARMCQGIHSNPVGTLIYFGLAKYHLLFCVISTFGFLCATGYIAAFVPPTVAAGSASTPQGVLCGAVLVLLGLNFAMDDSWAALHISWIGHNYWVLLPQALVATWNVWLGSRTACSWCQSPENDSEKKPLATGSGQSNYAAAASKK